MAAIKDLLQQISDPILRERLTEEVNRISKNKKFGLVFEEHVPECTPLYGVPIRRGSTVTLKTGKMNDMYVVKKISGEDFFCQSKITHETVIFKRTDLVSVAQFGEPIFPSLEPIDRVENAPNDSLWHTIIEADNYHALQLLEYLYEGKVDCIYIDPPYNTGAKDWKYNNDYVDSSDSWRHSKWLSMMKKRLLIARRILNSDTGVLIVTVDEHEVHNLRVLLQDLFPECYIQMVTDVINPKGVTQGRFSRVEEYNVFCFMPNAYVTGGDDPLLGEKTIVTKPRWKGLLRSGTNARRIDRKNMFYPILIDADNSRVVRACESIPFGVGVDVSKKIDGFDVAWPIRTDGSEGNWGVGYVTLNRLIDKGYVAVGGFDKKRNTWAISYLSQRPQKQIDTGELIIINFDQKRNVVDVEYAAAQEKQIKSVWHRSLHDSGVQGSDLVSGIIGQTRAFSFPKSLYSTKDAVAAVVRNNPNALIVDFFAGSGTTLHAVNLTNIEDNGKRRCILITNNEVSESEAKELKEANYQPGDVEWEQRGICRSVTWPRTKYSILGKRTSGVALLGEYHTNQTTTKEINRIFYQLGFIDNVSALSTTAKKQIVAMINGQISALQKKVGRLQSDVSKSVKGVIGESLLPQSAVKSNSRFVFSDKHTVSMLFDTEATDEWLTILEEHEHITEFYIVTKNNQTFSEIKTKVINLLDTVSVTETMKRPMSDGFPTNVEYFKLGFLDKNSVSLGQQFAEILPLLWLKTGAVGKRPELDGEELPDMLILPQNSFAVLINEDCYSKFAEGLSRDNRISTVYFVTNSEEAFREMSDGIGIKQTYQLYRDYIDNFVIGSRRNHL